MLFVEGERVSSPLLDKIRNGGTVTISAQAGIHKSGQEIGGQLANALQTILDITQDLKYTVQYKESRVIAGMYELQIFLAR